LFDGYARHYTRQVPSPCLLSSTSSIAEKTVRLADTSIE
jgi:hypothetical protein